MLAFRISWYLSVGLSVAHVQKMCKSIQKQEFNMYWQYCSKKQIYNMYQQYCSKKQNLTYSLVHVNTYDNLY